jgi:hypothetical protein
VCRGREDPDLAVLGSVSAFNVGDPFMLVEQEVSGIRLRLPYGKA